VRFGIGGSVLYNTVSTAASDGGINSTLDSFTPIGGAMALINMALGEIIVGGVGAGLYSILLYVLLAVFIAGLMVGRTPEFLGKKITSKEMKLVMIALLISPFFMLLFTAIACLTPNAIASIANHGPHGFTEIFYAYISTAANNGSAFAGLNANTNFYNITTGLNMFFGRFLMIIPVLAIAGLLANKKRTPESAGTLPTTGPLFIGLLIGTIIIVAGLTFFPGVTLGPILEQIMMKAGTLF
jgi:K+-transporting ATPase ATPase A chain